MSIRDWGYDGPAVLDKGALPARVLGTWGDYYRIVCDKGEGIARKKTTVSTASTQKTATASSQKITAGQTYSLSGVSYTIPAGYNNTSANVIVSRAGL